MTPDAATSPTDKNTPTAADTPHPKKPDEAATHWLELLTALRPHLTGRDARGKRGSLRWLEAVIAERGGRAGTVRNILYKDLGSSDEKIRLFELLSELYEEAGLPAPDVPSELSAAAAKRLLGRDKRLIFARFTRDLAAGSVPQLVVVGGPATGKGVLLEQVRAHVADSLFVNLAHDLAPALFALVTALGLEPAYDRLLAQLSPAQPFAVQAALQDELRALLADGLNRAGRPLLVRAQADATLAGLPLRDAESREVELSHWLEPLLDRLRVPYLVACSSAPATLDYKFLRQPSRDEARRYLRQRLPDANDSQLESLLNRGGRSYGELSRLVLLEMSRAGTQGEDRLLNDPQLGPLLRILAALSPETDPEIPVPLLEKVVGKSLSALTQAERALLEPLQGDTVRPVLRTLLPFEQSDHSAHQVAFGYYQNQTQHTPFRTLYHAYHAGEYGTLVERIDRDPSTLALLPGLWAEAAHADGWPTTLRERLAVAVVRYRAVLGDYRHPEAQGALAYLSDAGTPTMSAWAKVKQAEAHIDAGRYAEAEALVTDLPRLEGDARAEALLVDAALARWHGTYDRAERLVAQALALPAAPLLESRARLWQGLVAKDAGRFGEALSSLERVRDNPLLAGRARYQEGDLLMRLGRPAEGATRIEAGLEQLADAAPAEERARVRARLGTVLRRLGRYDDAADHLYQALGTAPDPFTRARIASEASILESARDRPWQALRLASEAETVFRHSDARPEEARYRYLRTLYRLAVAYWSWRSGQPYRPPFRGGPVIAQAKTILKARPRRCRFARAERRPLRRTLPRRLCDAVADVAAAQSAIAVRDGDHARKSLPPHRRPTRERRSASPAGRRARRRRVSRDLAATTARTGVARLEGRVRRRDAAAARSARRRLRGYRRGVAATRPVSDAARLGVGADAGRAKLSGVGREVARAPPLRPPRPARSTRTTFRTLPRHRGKHQTAVTRPQIRQ
ncbi:MAG: hypothetical protein U5L04_00960 [Trueperaceae bacterium]|nr:hypothetical protein [Trueperaceae bacterium]